MTYATVNQLREYAAARGLTVPEADNDCLVLLTVAQDWLETQDYIGERTGIKQTTAWPRTGVFLYGFRVGSDEIPDEIVKAQCQLAIDSMSVDFMPVSEGREVIKEKIAGAVEVEYAATGGLVMPQPVKAKAMIRLLLKGASSGMGGFTVYRL